MDRFEIEQAAQIMADVLGTIEAGEVEATPIARAYLAGSLHALRAVLGEEELGQPLVS